MKKITIDTNKLAKAPIDQKHIIEDAVYDSLFLNEGYVWHPESNEAVGFVNQYPTLARCHSNVLILFCLHTPRIAANEDDWCSAVAMNLTGVRDYIYASLFPVRRQYLDTDNDIVITLTFNGNGAFVEYHFNTPL